MTILAVLAALWLANTAGGAASTPAANRFEKLTDHYFVYQSATDPWNVGAVITGDGILLIDPPPEAGLTAMQEALRKVTPSGVKWVVHTDFRREIEGSVAQFARQGAVVLGSRESGRLVTEAARSSNAPAPQAGKESKAEEKRPAASRGPRLTFERQMRLFPAGVEVRVMAVQHRARTAGDVVVILPAEKVLQTGNLYSPSGFPEVDQNSGGSAGGWIDGLKQVVDAVPVLKPAIPPPKGEVAQKAAARPGARPGETGKVTEEEKSLEELIAVVPGRGPASNLMEMKALLESAQKMRSEIARGKGRLNVATAGSLAPYRSLSNFEAFAALLSEELARPR